MLLLLVQLLFSQHHLELVHILEMANLTFMNGSLLVLLQPLCIVEQLGSDIVLLVITKKFKTTGWLTNLLNRKTDLKAEEFSPKSQPIEKSA